MFTKKTKCPSTGAVKTPVLGSYPPPILYTTRGNTNVPLFQEALDIDIPAVKTTVLVISEKFA
jgi:hypothetical protein